MAASGIGSPVTVRATILPKNVSAAFWHTNTVENYFSIFKRGVFVSYFHVSEAHLHRYGVECDSHPRRCRTSMTYDRTRPQIAFDTPPFCKEKSRRRAYSVSLPVSAKGQQRIAHQRVALLPAGEGQTVPGEFFLRSFDGNVRASGAAVSPAPRRSQDPRDRHP